MLPNIIIIWEKNMQWKLNDSQNECGTEVIRRHLLTNDNKHVCQIS